MSETEPQFKGPAIAVVVLVGAFNMLGDCLRDALDPKAVRQ